MYTMKILEREPALSHFLSAHLPPRWGRALSSAPAGRADLVVVSPDLIQVPSAPTACRALLAPGSLAHLAGELSAAWVVSYGLTPRDTLTFSSLEQDTLCLALQTAWNPRNGPCPGKVKPLPSSFWPARAFSCCWGSRRRRSGWAGDRGRLFPHKKKDIRLDVFFLQKNR